MVTVRAHNYYTPLYACVRAHVCSWIYNIIVKNRRFYVCQDWMNIGKHFKHYFSVVILEQVFIKTRNKIILINHFKIILFKLIFS